MAAAVLGGLTVSTILSLVVVPAFYVVADRTKNRLAALLFGKKRARTSNPRGRRINRGLYRSALRM